MTREDRENEIGDYIRFLDAVHGEVTDPDAPAYDPTAPRAYEITAQWQSEEITTFTDEVTIPAGSTVLVGYSAANRDERVFEAPARFDLDRTDGKKHLTFGFGTHFCLGAPLARRELLHGFTALEVTTT